MADIVRANGASEMQGSQEYLLYFAAGGFFQRIFGAGESEGYIDGVGLGIDFRIRFGLAQMIE